MVFLEDYTHKGASESWMFGTEWLMFRRRTECAQARLTQIATFVNSPECSICQLHGLREPPTRPVHHLGRRLEPAAARLKVWCSALTRGHVVDIMQPKGGIEPPTFRLRSGRSASKLRRQIVRFKSTCCPHEQRLTEVQFPLCPMLQNVLQ